MDLVKRWLEDGPRDDPEAPALIAEARRGYDAGLRALDDALGGFLESADAERLLDRTIVVLCSDHGEGFGEHRAMHHGRRLYEELTHVPLAIRAPGQPAGAVVDGPCSLADVAPTILELAGFPPPIACDGRSLVARATGREGPAGARPAVSEERRTRATGVATEADLVAVRDATTTWIGTRDAAGRWTEEAYDRLADPRETRPIDVEEALARASEGLRRAVEARRR